MEPNVALTGEDRRLLKAYERGTVWSMRGKLHALRPAGIADQFGRRASLCGCLASPRGRPFATIHPESCSVCAAVAENRPIAQPLAPSEQLATLRAYLDASAVLLARTTRGLDRPLTPGEQTLAALTNAA
jgi:hypothetical protein